MSKKKEQLIELGQIIGFHGIKGEMKVKSFSDNPERFIDLEKILIDGRPHKIKKARTQKGYAFLTLENINNRNEAEAFRNKILTLNREDLEELEEDEYYIVDLIGFPVIDFKTNQKIGVLKDITQTSGPVDNFVIQTNEKLIYVPALKEYFDIDMENKELFSDIPEDYFNL